MSIIMDDLNDGCVILESITKGSSGQVPIIFEEQESCPEPF